MEEVKNRQNLTPIAIIIAGIIIAIAVVGKDYLPNLTSKNNGTENGGKTRSEDGRPLDEKNTLSDKLKDYAQGLGLDSKQFSSCIDSEKYKPQIEQSMQEVQNMEISGTPTLIINGTKIGGLVPFDIYKYFIEKELGNAVNKEDIYKNLGISEDQKLEFDNYISQIESTSKVTGLESNLAASKGNENAEVKFIEVSDYQCPVCKSYFIQALPQIKSEYIDTGKISYAIKDFPLVSIHPNAFKAAEAARCAGDQGKYWEMHDKLFESQADWSELPQT